MCAASLEHPVIRLASRLGREPRAEEAEHVLRRTGSHGAARFELARLLQAQRRYGEAEREWRSLAETVPGELGARQGHVRVLRLLHRFGEAEAQLAAARQRFGDVRAVVLEAARLAMQREEHAAAAAHYHRALAMPGSAAEPLDELAKVLTAQHRFAAARVILTRLAEAEPALRARWDGLAVNEQRVSLALAARVRTLYAEDTLRFLGLKKGSVDRALAGLVGKAEARQAGSGVELTDPLLEHWLAERGLF